MPTFKICVFKHQERKDGKFRVSIRLRHNRQVSYIKTDTYVIRKQIAQDFKSLRDADVTRRIDRDIINYESLLLRGLGSNLDRFNAKELVNYIEKHIATEGGAGIDFVTFSRNYIDSLKAKKRDGYAEGFTAVIRHLIDFFEREVIYIKEINAKNLQKFAIYMQGTRKMVRINQFGKEYEIVRKGVKPQTVKDYLGAIQTLFNAACTAYNDENEETAIITHNPFKTPFIVVAEEPHKRDLNVTDLIKIIKFDGGTGRMELARDVFLLSFYLIGMNTADLYGELAKVSDGRLTYERQKTTTRRKDKAIMSVKIEPEVTELIEKYRDCDKKRVFSFYKMYGHFKYFNKNLNIGMKQLAAALDLPQDLSTYYSRHTWATIASEDCGYSENDISRALNHIGEENSGKSLRVTRGYIHRRWEKTDNMNRKVLDFVISLSTGDLAAQ